MTLALLLSGGQVVTAAPDPARVPLQYPWAASYMEVAHELASQGVPIIEEREGVLLRVRRGELEVSYRFYMEEKIGDIILKEREEEGERRMVLDRLQYEAAHPPEEAKLYAVDVLLPGIVLEQDGPDAGGLVARLSELYAPQQASAKRQRRRWFEREDEAKQPASAKREAGSLSFRDASTAVRVDYVVQGQVRYARRMSLVSRPLNRQRNRQIEALRKEADRRVRLRLRQANRELKRRIRSEQ